MVAGYEAEYIVSHFRWMVDRFKGLNNWFRSSARSCSALTIIRSRPVRCSINIVHMCNLAPQKITWISQFPTNATVQYVVHRNSTVTCVLIDKRYTLTRILAQRKSLRLHSPHRPAFGFRLGLRTQDSGTWIPRLRPCSRGPLRCG